MARPFSEKTRLGHFCAVVGPIAPCRASAVSGKRPHALFTALYRSTDSLCRGGAAMKNLAHIAPGSRAAIVTPLSGAIHQERFKSSLKHQAPEFKDFWFEFWFRQDQNRFNHTPPPGVGRRWDVGGWGGHEPQRPTPVNKGLKSKGQPFDLKRKRKTSRSGRRLFPQIAETNRSAS